MREKLAESVLEVKRVSDRLMAMKLEVKGSILNTLNAYVPQVNNSMVIFLNNFFYTTMPRNCFIKILKYLRFDDKPNRLKTGPNADRFAPIRKVFEIFVSLWQKKYVCNFSLAIDEQLMPLKSICSFTTFMAKKPDKYEIKFWVRADVRTEYIINIISYLGAQEKEKH